MAIAPASETTDMNRFLTVPSHLAPQRTRRQPPRGRLPHEPAMHPNKTDQLQNSNVAPILATRAASTDVGVSQAELSGLYVWL